MFARFNAFFFGVPFFFTNSYFMRGRFSSKLFRSFTINCAYIFSSFFTFVSMSLFGLSACLCFPYSLFRKYTEPCFFICALFLAHIFSNLKLQDHFLLFFCAFTSFSSASHSSATPLWFYLITSTRGCTFFLIFFSSFFFLRSCFALAQFFSTSYFWLHFSLCFFFYIVNVRARSTFLVTSALGCSI